MQETGRNQWSHTASINMNQASIHSAKNHTTKPEDYNPWLAAAADSEKKINATSVNGFAALKALVGGVKK